jgi:hypothetical protein
MNCEVLFHQYSLEMTKELKRACDEFQQHDRNEMYGNFFFEGLELLSLHEELKEIIKIDFENFSYKFSYSYIMSFLVFVMHEYSHVSEWIVSRGPSVKDIANSQKKNEVILCILLLGIRYVNRTVTKKLESYYKIAIAKLSELITSFYSKHHFYGLESLGWASYHAALSIFYIEDLIYVPHIYKDPFVFLKNNNTQQIEAYVSNTQQFNSFGQYYGVNQLISGAFITDALTNEHEKVVHRVNPTGYVEKHKKRYNLKDWSEILIEHDYVIDIHIPKDTNFDLKNLKHTLKKGYKFFENNFKDIKFKAFWCNSWIFSPQLLAAYNKTSNLTNIWKKGFILPAKPNMNAIMKYVFNRSEIDHDTYIATTSLQKALINYISSGNKMNTGIFIYFFKHLKDLDKKNKMTYIKQEDLKENLVLFRGIK